MLRSPAHAAVFHPRCEHEQGFTRPSTAHSMRAVTLSNDEPELRARASMNARDLVDKLQQQAVELQGDPRFADGAALARAAVEAAQRVQRLLADISPPPDRGPV
jgi:hypothetical protein